MPSYPPGFKPPPKSPPGFGGGGFGRGRPVIRLSPTPLRLTIIALGKTKVTWKQAARASVYAAGQVLTSAVQTNISLTDHTQADLDRLGNPYARRHGTIMAGRLGHKRTKYITNVENLVHSQSGAMRRALRGVYSEPAGKPQWRVSFNGNAAGQRHAEEVIKGTDVMLPRDVLWDTANTQGTQRAIMKAIVTTLGKGLRTKAVVRFGGL